MTNWTKLFGATAASALLLTGCSQNITGTAVTAVAGAGDISAAGGDEAQCTTVDAPLDDIPSEDDSEPLLRIGPVRCAAAVHSVGHGPRWHGRVDSTEGGERAMGP